MELRAEQPRAPSALSLSLRPPRSRRRRYVTRTVVETPVRMTSPRDRRRACPSESDTTLSMIAAAGLGMFCQTAIFARRLDFGECVGSSGQGRPAAPRKAT